MQTNKNVVLALLALVVVATYLDDRYGVTLRIARRLFR